MRLDFDSYLLALAKAAALRGTCIKRQVGAVVADRHNKVVAVSYNGPPSGHAHCIDMPCKAIGQAAPMSHLACRAIHGELNALMLAGANAENGTLAVTTSPCADCVKVIINAKIKKLIVGEVNRLFDDVSVYSISPRAMRSA